MVNESEVDVIATENNNDGADTTKVDTTKEGDTKETKESEVVVETPEAKRARLQRQLEQHNKKYGFDAETKQAPKTKQSDEFDEGQLAYLATKSIESDEDIDFTKAELKKHGGTLRELLGNEYFKATLKARHEAKAVLDATPKGQNRGNTNPTNEVDYHLAKYKQSGTLPSDPEMRQKVVNARLKQETVGRQFTDTPVVG